MITIGIEGAEFFGYHGVYPEERITGTRFTVDVQIVTESNFNGLTDQLSETLDYSDAYKIVSEIMSVQVQLIESLVFKIGKELRAKFPLSSLIKVRVNKWAPQIGGVCEKVYVESAF
jgi:dihydroneopterin aldolase